MPKYMLLNYLPTKGGPAPEEMREQHARWMRYDQDLKEAGLFLANDGLAGPDAATTVRVRGGETQLTDGPFAETKEYLAGYFLIEAPDLDVALEWAARMPSSSYGSVEVRPVWGQA
ncbi:MULTISPECIES: YciI family protein [Kitasatospora]|uniref:YciI family protein n=1 Tax=Kitasatospora cystarginea TaxID=58350 RepID=A0ABN3ESX3_9ACTN